MSTLKLDKITGLTGNAGDSAPITLSGDTATLETGVTIGSGVTIPAAGITGTIGSGVTIPAAGVTGTLGSGVVFPAGHVVKTSFIGVQASTPAVSTASASYVDTALEIAHTTALSSDDSFLRYDYYSSGMQVDGDNTYARIDVTMRTVQNSTYTVGESIAANPSTQAAEYRYKNQYGVEHPTIIKLYCGLVSGMGMPATKSSWAAGDTLYFRMFIKSSGSSFIVQLLNSTTSTTITEIAR
jgi:hypothetical protein